MAKTGGVPLVRRYLINIIQVLQSISSNYVPLGLGTLRAEIRRQLGAPFVQAFENTVSYTVNNLRLGLTREIGMHSYISIQEERAAASDNNTIILRLPSNTKLVDGLLVSLDLAPPEGIATMLRVCFDGNALTIYDIETPVLDAAKIIPQEGMYRARATGADAFMTPDMPMDTVMWYVFTDAAFLQGIISMDRITKAVEPSCTDLQMYHNGQWVPARVTNYDWQAPVTIQ